MRVLVADLGVFAGSKKGVACEEAWVGSRAYRAEDCEVAGCVGEGEGDGEEGSDTGYR